MLGVGFFNKNLYDKVRSDYSLEVTSFIQSIFSVQNSYFTAVELGAGSGKFTESIIKSKIPIKELYIVEPDSEGIKKHKERFIENKSFPIIYKNAASEATGLDDNIANIVFCGHCFHWFDFETTKKEFLRILKDSGQVFILGRFLNEEDEITKIYVKLTRFGKRKEGFSNNIEAYENERMNKFYGHPVERKIICEESIPYTFSQMLGKLHVRINSSGHSWIMKKLLSVGKTIELLLLFCKHKTQKQLLLKYTTFAFCSEMAK